MIQCLIKASTCIGLRSGLLNSPAIYSPKWSVIPSFPCTDHFLYWGFSQFNNKIEKSPLEASNNISSFLSSYYQNFLRDVGGWIWWPLYDVYPLSRPFLPQDIICKRFVNRLSCVELRTFTRSKFLQFNLFCWW